jgi:hypothetical protein
MQTKVEKTLKLTLTLFELNTLKPTQIVRVRKEKDKWKR